MKNNTISKKLIIIISSPSGAGKSSICKRLLEDDSNIKMSISDTTRLPRDNEIDGDDYNFITNEKFKIRVANNKYIEYAKVFGNYYGSLNKNVKRNLNSGFDVLFDIDWQGSLQLKNSNHPNILTIFITPPSKEEIFKRLKLRAKKSGDDEQAINNRLNMYETEMSHHNEYDYLVENNNFEECISRIKKIIENTRKKLNK